ncbi:MULTISPECIES: S8 family serine peptidase [unclassified Microcoleus]|uniref:S8 family serine peptidase n=1 Tax=unclassified Microcoleus TaxID=2642155 RepID=UPI002FD23DA7
MVTINEGQSNVLLKGVTIADTLPGSLANDSILNPLISSNKQTIGQSSLIVDSKYQPAIEPEKVSATTDLQQSNPALSESNSKKSDDSLIVTDPLKSSLNRSISSNTGTDTLSGSQSAKDTLTGSSKDAQSIAIKSDTLTATDSLTNNQNAKETPPTQESAALAEKENNYETDIAKNKSIPESKETTIAAPTNPEKLTGEKPVTAVDDATKDISKPTSTASIEAVEISKSPKETTIAAPTNSDKLTGEKPVTAIADAAKDSNKPSSTASTEAVEISISPKETTIAAPTNPDKLTGEKPVTAIADATKDSNKPTSTASTEAVEISISPKETTIAAPTNPEKLTGEKPVTAIADATKDISKPSSTATTGDKDKQVTKDTQVSTIETAKELNQAAPKPEPVADNSFTSGKFLVDSTGKVGIDFLFDGGLYKGQLAIFSLKGIQKFVPGSTEFIKEVASRAVSNSVKGHLVINDLSEGARFTGNLPEGNYNEATYLGVKTFAMTPGDEFGVMLVPNGTVQEVLNNPVVGGDKRPLFSMTTANPAEGFHVGQIADVTGSGKTFAMEDMRVDLGSDRDYNDVIFQVRGATGTAVNLDSVINPEKDWRKADIGKALIAYAKPYVEPKVEAVQEEKKPAKNTDSGSVLDVPIPDNASVSKEKVTSPTNTESLSKTEVVTSEKAVTPAVKTEDEKPAIANPVVTPTLDIPVSDKAVVSEVKTEGEKQPIANSVATPTLDIPVSDKAVVSEVKAEGEKQAIANSVATPTLDIPASDTTVTPAVKTEDDKPAIANSVATPTLDIPVSDKAVVSEVKTQEEKQAIANPVTTSTLDIPVSELAVVSEVKSEGEKLAIANPVTTSTLDIPVSELAVVSEVKSEGEKLAIANPVATSTKDIPASDKAVVSEVKSEGEKLAIANSVATPTLDIPASDKAVVSEVKTEDEKQAIANPVTTSTKDIPASDKAVVSEVKAEGEKLAIVLTSTPNESVKTDAVTSSPTVVDPLKIKEEKEAIAISISTPTKDAPASDTTVTKSVVTESQAIAPQPESNNISTVEIKNPTNQPEAAVTLNPPIDEKLAIPTQEFGKDFQPIVHETKPNIYPQEVSTVNQSIAIDSKPVTAIPELAEPAISTNIQPPISIQEVAPVTQRVPPNATSTTATNSQEKTNTEPTISAQNIGSNPIATANSFHSPKASQPLVGIISTGFNAKNLDIDYSRITLGKDRIANDDNPLIQSGEGSEQGTHVLGLIAATQDNSTGIDGINNEAPIWLGRASGNNSWAESLIEFADAAKISGQPNAVVNISFELTKVDDSGKIVPRYELTESETKALEYARKNQIVVVVPVGNNPQEISALGKASLQFDNIISVGASSGGQVTNYSGTGKGLDILTEGGTLNNPVRSTVGETTGLMAGTSVAAAQVTGAISQVWAANPQLNYQQVIDIIKRTATDIALPNWDAKTGAGLLNMAAAVPLAKATEPKPLLPEPTVQDVVTQLNNLAPDLDRLLEQFKAESDKIAASPDSALVEPKPEDEKQAAEEMDAAIAELQKELDDLQTDPYADIDGIATAYQFAFKDQPLVGIIDTGFAENNPDIDYTRIITGRDYNDGDDNPLLPASDSKAEHGTKVLEVIGAKQNNDIGINGVNDDAPLWLGRAVGSGKWAQSLREFVDAFKTSKQPHAIVNLSFDLTEIKDGVVVTRTKFTAEERSAIEYARDNKVLIVAAAGNQGVEGLSALGKASQEFANIITVGAADWNGNLADYSSYGAGIDLVAFGSTPDGQASSNANSNEDLLKDLTPEERQALEKAIKFNEAPTDDSKLTEAEENLVLEATKKLGKSLGDIKDSDSNSAESIPEIVGTSIAAAKVTGAASQVWAANPNLSFAQVKAILKATAVDLGTPGWDIQTGAGLLNLADAVAMAKSPPSVIDLGDSILSSDSDVWNGEGAGEQEARRRGFFRRLFRRVRRIFQKVSGFVSKVVGFVKKVSGFIRKVKGFFSKVSGIFSKVKKVFSWISKKFLALPILGKVGIVLGGLALVGGAIAGLVAWFKKKKQPPAQPPVEDTTPQNIKDLKVIWGGLPTPLKTALKNGITSTYGAPLFNGQAPDNVVKLAITWATLTPQQQSNLWPSVRNDVPVEYYPFFDGTDPNGILPIFNALGLISLDARNTVSTFLPGGIPSQYQSNFP